MSHTEQTDVAVIGAGPIGLELAVALKSAGVDYLQFDARQIGYTVSWFAPQTKFFSSNDRIAIAGVPLQTADQNKATREQYLAYLRSVVQQFDLSVRTYEPVLKVERDGREFRLTTRAGGSERTCTARKVVFCTGGTDRPRRLGIPGEDLPHVSHYFKDPHLYFRRRLLVVGGKNSAIEAALRCHTAGASVAISYRRHQFDARQIKYWLLPEMNGLVAAGRIDGLFDSVPERITPDSVRLKRADGTVFEEPFDFVLLLVGYEADMTLLRSAGVSLAGDCQVPVFDPRTMETDVPGLYVAGCAIGGTQDKYSVFLESCHVHVQRIIAALSGRPADLPTPVYAGAES
jgi:thioredoxin reductase (NADPH)